MPRRMRQRRPLELRVAGIRVPGLKSRCVGSGMEMRHLFCGRVVQVSSQLMLKLRLARKQVTFIVAQGGFPKLSKCARPTQAEAKLAETASTKVGRLLQRVTAPKLDPKT